MKNLLSTLSRMFTTRTWGAVRGHASQPFSRTLEQQDLCTPVSWQMLVTLLEAQARVHAMNMIEPPYSCKSVRAEALDMALRESIRAHSLALGRFQEEGIVSEELLEELVTHAATQPTQAASQPFSGNPRSHIKAPGE